MILGLIAFVVVFIGAAVIYGTLASFSDDADASRDAIGAALVFAGFFGVATFVVVGIGADLLFRLLELVFVKSQLQARGKIHRVLVNPITLVAYTMALLIALIYVLDLD